MTAREVTEAKDVVAEAVRENTNSKPAFRWGMFLSHMGIVGSIVVGLCTLFSTWEGARQSSEAYQKVQKEKAQADIDAAVALANRNGVIDETVKAVGNLKKSVDEVKKVQDEDHKTIKEIGRRMNGNKHTDIPLFGDDLVAEGGQ